MSAATAAASEFRLPDVGEGLTEAEIVTWHVSVGDTVAINDVICDIETAKSVVELPSPYAGVVLALLVPVGETVEVGTPIIRIGDPSAEVPAGRDEVPAGRDEEPEEAPQQTLVGYGPKEASVHRRPRRGTGPAASGAAEQQGPRPPAGEGAGSAASEFRLPDVGEGLTEAEIVTWHVSVGDTVAINDVICDIETAKSVVELPSPYAGVVLALLVPVGETVEVGTPIIRIGDPSAEVPAGPAEVSAGRDEEPEEAPQQTLVGYGPKEASVHRRPRHGSAPAGSGAAAGERQRPLAKPPVRGLAKELGVDLATLSPSGPQGDVTPADVEAAAARVSEAAAAPAAPAAPATPAAPAAPAAPRPSVPLPAHDHGGRVTREPIKGVRKMMGQAMVASAFSVPHVTIWTTVDVTQTSRACERLRALPDYADIRVSPLLLLARASIEALRRHPLLNSVWDESAGEVVLRHFVNLGIAAATPRGLVVPNIKDADLKSLPDLGAALNRLTAVAREGRTQPADQAGGTFTITNVGPFGMEGGTPIINPGESAILCFGAVSRRPWVVQSDGEERLAIRDVCTLSLSFDHRHIDGATGSAFLADVAAQLADPAGLLA